MCQVLCWRKRKSVIKNNPFLPFKEGNYSTRKTQVCTNLRFKVLRNNASPILSEEEGNSGYRITLVKTQFSNVTFTGLGVRASTCLWGCNLNQQETFRCPWEVKKDDTWSLSNLDSKWEVGEQRGERGSCKGVRGFLKEGDLSMHKASGKDPGERVRFHIKEEETLWYRHQIRQPGINWYRDHFRRRKGQPLWKED